MIVPGAELIAFGPMCSSVRSHLDYPEECYAEVSDGDIMSASPVYCRGEGSADKLAAALGIEVWDFKSHFIRKMSTIQLAGLKIWLRDQAFAVDVFDDLKALRNAGWSFMFRHHCQVFR